LVEGRIDFDFDNRLGGTVWTRNWNDGEMAIAKKANSDCDTDSDGA
jgi:hypothetical protein